MRSVLRVLIAFVAAIVLIVLAIWLNFPRSAILFVSSLADQRHPVTFDFAFAGIPQTGGNADIELLYMPETPIVGITQHYYTMIAPMQIDRLTRAIHPPVRNNAVHFEAPLSIVGLSNYRLAFISLKLPQVRHFPENFGISRTEKDALPPPSSVPSATVEDGAYDFEGPFALWQLTGSSGTDSSVIYSPRYPDQTRPAIWTGLRAFRARIAMTPYAVPTFAAPAEWSGFGWHRDGVNVTQPGAAYTDEAVTMRAGSTVRIPFARDCTLLPEFVSLAKGEQPEWARPSGLWAPVELTQWRALQRIPDPHALATRFIALNPAPENGVEPVEVRAQRSGSYRLFGACPAPKVDSVAVAWIDVRVAP